MARPRIRSGEQAMDWKPLEHVVGTAELENWMWMHCTPCGETGADVHFYKHVWSRRYLRIDAEGRVYKEMRDGTPVALRGCGGGTLVLLLLMATAWVDRGMPPAISLPDAAREPCTVEDLPELADIIDYVSRDVWTTIEQLECQTETPSHISL